jgi:hypothetical protein
LGLQGLFGFWIVVLAFDRPNHRIIIFDEPVERGDPWTVTVATRNFALAKV